MKKHSTATEDYLKNLFFAQEELGTTVPMKRLSNLVGVTPGTATVMVKSLSERGLLNHEPRTGTSLTQEGRELALRMVRRQRLLELFLVKIMEMDWSEVREEAEVLEHAVSDRLIQRISEILHHPLYDPHGDPIPSDKLEWKAQDSVTLSEVQNSQKVEIIRVDDRDPEFLQWAADRELLPGVILSIDNQDRAGDTVGIKFLDGKVLIIGGSAAARFDVRIVD